MTAPGYWQGLADQAAQAYGPGSKMFQDELAMFNAARDSFWGKLAFPQGQVMTPAMWQGQQGGAPQQPQSATLGVNGRQFHAQLGPQDWQDEDLVGAATYWGVPENIARSMPRDQLIEVVNQARTKSRPAEDTIGQRLGATPGMLMAIPEMFTLGMGQAITGGLQRLPIIGEALSRTKLVHDSDLKLRQLEEMVRSRTPEDFQWVNSGANIAGNIAALWFPGTAAWAVAGKVGAALPWIGKAGPIARLAAQGSISGVLLAGRPVTSVVHDVFSSDEPVSQKEVIESLGLIGGGALLPLAWRAAEPMIGAAATRITKAFVSPGVLEPVVKPGDLAGIGAPMEAAVRGPGDATVQLRRLAEGGDAQAKFMLEQIEGRPFTSQDTRLPAPLQGMLSPETFVEDAGKLAAQMNKAATIVQSPMFPEIANSTLVDEASVATAALSENPGGVNLVQGIPDPAKFAASVAQAHPGQNVRFAQRGTRLDAILHDEPISDAMVGEYERTGVFTGQKVLTPEGIGGTVSKIEGFDAWVKPDYHDVPWKVGTHALHPWMTSPGSKEVPGMWDAYNAYVDQRVSAAAEAMGGAMSPGQVQGLRTQGMQQYMEDFFQETGVNLPADQARIRKYFNLKFVESYKAMEPEAAAFQNVALAQAAPTDVERATIPVVQSLDRAAAVKGMVAIPDGKGGWVLKDQVTTSTTQPTQVSFPTAEAAQEWVTRVNKDLPDITPQTDVPIELQAMHPTEPTQGPNLNGREDTILGSIAELEADAEGGGNVPPAVVHAANGNIGRLKNAWTEGFLRWKPARRLFSQLDQVLTEQLHATGAAGADPGFARDYDLLSNKLVQHHNDQHPWMDRASDMMKKVDTKRLIDGSFTRIYEIEDDAARLAAAQAAGFKPREIDALEEVNQFFKDMFPETGLDPVREIKRYVSHIGQRQSDPATFGRAFDDFPLGPATQPFYEYARTGNLNAREMDMRELLDTYIRAVTWKKNMAEPFNAVANKWKGLSEDEVLKPAANIMENWLKIIRYGYHANDDLALDTMHGAMRMLLGPSVTKQQARELFNFGLNSTHSSLLGFRLNVMARDIQQFWLAMPRVPKELPAAIGRYLSSGEARSQIWGDALEAGAIALQSPRMVSPGSFAGEMEAGAAAPGFSQQSARMRAAGRVTGAVRDMMPGFLKDARDTIAHPMYLYGKQSELMRALTYTAGRDKATAALTAFREAGAAGDMEALMGESGARTFDPAWQRQFQQLVGMGDDVGAAKFMGRQLADATQFKYGSTESPWVAKSMTGRVALQFGNYSMQYYQYLRESLVNGTLSDKAKFLMVAGGVTAGIEAASRKTGWNFRYMNPFFGLGFTTGPWVSLATSALAGANSMARGLYGNDPTQRDVTALGAAGTALGSAANMFNPAAGLWSTATGLAQAQQSPYPGLATTRFLITGDRNMTPDLSQSMMESATAALAQSQQPMQGPVRGSAYGTTQIPQNVPVYPSNMAPTQTGAPTSGGTPGDALPPPEVLRQLGVKDPSRVYWKNGGLVYDSTIMGPDGHVATHALNQAGKLLQPGQTWEDYETAVMGRPHGAAPTTVRDLGQLDGDTQGRIQALMQAAAQQGLQLSVGETARTQQRQEYLFQQGRSAGGKVATWTLTSNHADGRAIDFVVNGDSSGTSPAYQQLQNLAAQFGLVGMGKMDPGHFAATDSSRQAVPAGSWGRGASPQYPQGGGPPGGGAMF